MNKKQAEMEQEAREWNSWKPGSGRKGWSPFALDSFKEFEVNRMGTIPLREDGTIDMQLWEQELEESKK